MSLSATFPSIVSTRVDTAPRVSTRPYPRWPVLLLAVSAFVAIWGGWVSLGRMCGFGTVDLLPGITPVTVDLAITLPVGMEVYAAYATGAWLSRRDTDAGTRRYAKWSSLVSLFIGAGGQITYHLLSAAGIQHAPRPVTAVVATIPVAVLAMASQLAYRLATRRPDTTDPTAPSGRPTRDDEAPVDTTEHVSASQSAALDTAGQQPGEESTTGGPVGAEERQAIVDLAAAGHSRRWIARALGRSHTTIRRVLDQDQGGAAQPELMLVR